MFHNNTQDSVKDSETAIVVSFFPCEYDICYTEFWRVLHTVEEIRSLHVVPTCIKETNGRFTSAVLYRVFPTNDLLSCFEDCVDIIVDMGNIVRISSILCRRTTSFRETSQ